MGWFVWECFDAFEWYDMNIYIWYIFYGWYLWNRRTGSENTRQTGRQTDSQTQFLPSLMAWSGIHYWNCNQLHCTSINGTVAYGLMWRMLCWVYSISKYVLHWYSVQWLRTCLTVQITLEWSVPNPHSHSDAWPYQSVLSWSARVIILTLGPTFNLHFINAQSHIHTHTERDTHS